MRLMQRDAERTEATRSGEDAASRMVVMRWCCLHAVHLVCGDVLHRLLLGGERRGWRQEVEDAVEVADG